MIRNVSRYLDNMPINILLLKEKNWKTNNRNKGLNDKHKNVKYDTRNAKCGGQKSEKLQNDYQFKTCRYRSTYMKPMEITNQKPTTDIQKIKSNPNTTLKESLKQQRVDPRKKHKNREELPKRPKHNKQNGKKFIPVNTYFKRKML